jgi:hypothetical protein
MVAMTTAEDARQFRVALLVMTERLIAEFRPLAPAGRVMATVAVCRTELSGMGVRGDGLLDATEAMVRVRLSGWAPQLAAASGQRPAEKVLAQAR